MSDLHNGLDPASEKTCELLRAYQDDFWSRVAQTEGCWIWQGHIASGADKGYGYYLFTGAGTRFRILAHMAAFIIVHGPIPDGQVVRHLCDNRVCVNASQHLELGTQLENAADRVEHGRGAIGSLNGSAKLSEPDVIEIRRLLDDGASVNSLAQHFQVDRKLIRKIRDREIWTHI